MNSRRQHLKYLILLSCSFLCESFNPTDLLKTGIHSLFSLENESAAQDIYSFLPNPLPFSSESPSQKEHRTLYGKPIADKSSVLDSLFEINAKEYLSDEDDTSHQPVTETKINVEKENSLPSIFQDIDFLPLVNEDHRHKTIISPEDKPLLDYLDSMREEAWTHFKSIIITYINYLDSPSSKGTKIKESYPVKFMMKLMDMGDKINIVHLLGKKVDPEVSKFLIKTLRHSAPEILGLKNFTQGDISALMPTINRMINQFAWLSLQHIIDNLLVKVNSSFTDGELQKYISELESTNPFAAKGLRFVLSLPTRIPRYSSIGEGRSLLSRDGYGYHDDDYGHHDDGYGYYDDHGGYGPKDSGYGHKDIGYGHKDIGYGHKDIGYGHKDIGYGHKDIGYGHKDIGYGHKDVGYGDYGSHGSHGHGGGYQMGIKLDPYLILAGIGTAALLAFVAFKVLTTEAAAAPRGRLHRRSVEDLDTVSMVLNTIEDTQRLYENDFAKEAEDVINSVNVMWKQMSTESCARCLLFESLFQNINSYDSFRMIILSAFAQLLGTEKSGQLLDEMASNHLAGKELICDPTNEHSCNLRM